MRLASIFSHRLRSLLSRPRVEQELDEELRYHLDRQVEENLSAGMSPDEARFAALRSIADIEQRKEECRDTRGFNLLDTVARDFRYALRQLRKSPGFAATAIFVLALGISASVAIFGFVDAALIKPLPYRDQSRLIAVYESSAGWPRSLVSYFEFADWKHLNSVFSSVDAFAMNGSFTLTTVTGAQQVGGTRVSAGFFHTLGISPVLGREFQSGEDSPGAVRTAVLSYTGWQKRFGGKRDVLGRSVTLNGNPTIIIGVLPRDFQFAPYAGAEVWTTLRASDTCEAQRECHNLYTVARLKDGVSIEAASAQMNSIMRELSKRDAGANHEVRGANLVPLRDVIVGDVRPILLVMLSGAGLLLLIACVNVTTLLLARSDKRQREISVRAALGASSFRLFQQFATEGLVLAAMGGLLGIVLATWGMRFLLSLVPADKIETMPYLRGLGLSQESLLFACSLWLLAGLLFAAIPVARIYLSGRTDGLKVGARGSSGTAWRHFGSKLVIVEVALAMVLMVGAGLLAKSLYLLLHVDMGFTPDHVHAFPLAWPPANYADDKQKVALERKIVERLSTLSGVISVGITLTPPIDSAWGTSSFHIAGRPNRGEQNEELNRQVSPGYFKTLRSHMIRGRSFREDEDASKPLVAIVNQTLAKKYFAGEDPVGKLIYNDWEPRAPMQIVGVVEDIREGPLQDATWAALYVPYEQNPVAWPTVLVRTTSDAAVSLVPSATAAIHSIDPFISVSDALTLTERIDQSPSASLHRSSAWVVGFFAITALLLSVVGLYGVVAYSVSQRTREIGVRIALGAERLLVYRLILSEAGRLTVVGVLIGVVGSVAAATLMRSLLFGVNAWDAPTLIAVAAVLSISALLASYLPARRAASINPVEALRIE